MLSPELLYDPFKQNREDFLRYRLIPALRSGAYEQTQGQLHDENGFCCLGVMCDIIDNTQWQHRTTGGGRPYYIYVDNSGVLPESLAKKLNVSATLSMSLDIRKTFPKIPTEDGQGRPFEAVHASTLNDNGFTFSEIADIIEFALDNNMLLGYDEYMELATKPVEESALVEA